MEPEEEIEGEKYWQRDREREVGGGGEKHGHPITFSRSIGYFFITGWTTSKTWLTYWSSKDNLLTKPTKTMNKTAWTFWRCFAIKRQTWTRIAYQPITYSMFVIWQCSNAKILRLFVYRFSLAFWSINDLWFFFRLNEDSSKRRILVIIKLGEICTNLTRIRLTSERFNNAHIVARPINIPPKKNIDKIDEVT